MSVGELITKLNKYPKEMSVVFLNTDCNFSGEELIVIGPIEIWDMEKKLEYPLCILGKNRRVNDEYQARYPRRARSKKKK